MVLETISNNVGVLVTALFQLFLVILVTGTIYSWAVKVVLRKKISFAQGFWLALFVGFFQIVFAFALFIIAALLGLVTL